MKDICIIGSGAGASPVAYELSKAGYKVVVLEKGPWLKTEDFTKDELVATRKDLYIPNLEDESHQIVRKNSDGNWSVKNTADTGSDFWNGNVVGGSSNFMSGYFHRMKPQDFKLKSTYGEIEGANITDWPISYDDLEPYYAKVEEVIGVSGKVNQHKYLEPRSTPDFPYAPLATNIVSDLIDKAAGELKISTFGTPRAIISKGKDKRNACYYSNYCGSYGCSSSAKGSARSALLEPALETGNLEIIPFAKVFHLETDGKGKVIRANYYDAEDQKQFIEANLFVIAAQATETSRLLLMSKNKDFPNGLANNNDQVGKNLVFSSGGVGSCNLNYDDFDPDTAQKLKAPGLFVNRACQEWYEIEKEGKKIKGGTIDFLWDHANPVSRTIRAKWDGNDLLYGTALKEKIHGYFTKQRRLKFEIFTDWSPNDDCFVELSDDKFDKWGDPVGKIWTGAISYDKTVGEILAKNTIPILEKMGGKNISYTISNYPSVNLQAGGCRFGIDPETSVLDANCKAHEVENLYVTDGSFMPTGGSTTFTFTIYANAFRVADKILERLKTI
ncbi:GMC oxidoreductase [Parvicella tangerina]|uniref:Fructose dehydrogenase large subunit n=1 Tax=Parvicella tangerina TaxID=2829795 RepID=A0A916JKN3_9FLAO|nr:GMC family oxidoreductase [Parvicella tangerina]CAG5078576.1 Fructose dehydrogenase large subunit [Parvicella tangerina]